MKFKTIFPLVLAFVATAGGVAPLSGDASLFQEDETQADLHIRQLQKYGEKEKNRRDPSGSEDDGKGVGSKGSKGGGGSSGGGGGSGSPGSKGSKGGSTSDGKGAGSKGSKGGSGSNGSDGKNAPPGARPTYFAPSDGKGAPSAVSPSYFAPVHTAPVIMPDYTAPVAQPDPDYGYSPAASPTYDIFPTFNSGGRVGDGKGGSDNGSGSKGSKGTGGESSGGGSSNGSKGSKGGSSNGKEAATMARAVKAVQKAPNVAKQRKALLLSGKHSVWMIQASAFPS